MDIATLFGIFSAFGLVFVVIALGGGISLFIEFSTRSRREGILALEPHIQSLDEEFVRKGLQLSVDGMEPQAIQEIMETEIEAIRGRHELGADIFSTMAAFAPALGMIGTLIGLVQMLQSMDGSLSYPGPEQKPP